VRQATFAVLFLGAAITLGCGQSSEKAAENVPQSTPDEVTQATRERDMPTRGTFDPPTHIRQGGRTYLSRHVLDTLRVLKERHGITRDEAWIGEGGVLGNDYFEVWYTEGTTTVTHAMRVMDDMMRARAKFEAAFDRAPTEPLVVMLPPYMEQYTEWTSREYWHYSDLRADTMTIQPIYILLRRGIIQYAIPHEYYQWALGRLTNFGAPRWMEEGVASYYTGDGELIEQLIQEFPKEAHAMSLEKVEEALDLEESRQDTRIAYYHSYRIVNTLVERHGEEKLVELIQGLAGGYSLDEAFQEVYSRTFDDFLTSLAGNAKEM